MSESESVNTIKPPGDNQLSDDASKRAIGELEIAAKKKLDEIGEAAKAQINLIRHLEGSRCRRVLSTVIALSIFALVGFVITAARDVLTPTPLERISFIVCTTIIALFGLHIIERLNRED